jgi:hypothetical protein
MARPCRERRLRSCRLRRSCGSTAKNHRHAADIGVVQIAGERRRAARRNREQNPGRAASQPIRQPSTERSPTRRLPRVIPRLDHVPMSSPVTSFTPKQGQYLAFIYAYTRVLGRPPAEADLQKHFGVSPPSVHQMVLTLERAGLIRRQPGSRAASKSSFLPSCSRSYADLSCPIRRCYRVTSRCRLCRSG